MRCPKCRSLNTKRRGKRFLPSVGKAILRISCSECSFTGPVRHFPSLQEDDGLCEQIARESLERASVRILSRRYQKAKNTIMQIIHRVTERLPDGVAIAKQFRPLWSGILVFDGKVIRVYDQLATKLKQGVLSEDELRWMHKMRWLCGIDHGTGDLPCYDLAEAESRIELIMYFQKLKSIHYPLKAIVCDGNEEIPHAAKFVFGERLVVQQCTRHFIEDLHRLLPSEQEHAQERVLCTSTMNLIQRVIEADTIEQSADHLETLRLFVQRQRSPTIRVMIDRFKQNKEKLCAHLLHPELHLPHTSNDIESLFKQLNLRFKSIGRFFNFRYANDYLNAWALLRRFTPFTDCCKTRRERNGKAPLAIAGAHIKNIDPMKLRR